MYEKNKLKEYIKNSELRVFNKDIKVRLSKELAIKYDKGYYNEYLNNISKYIKMIKKLNIKYPGMLNLYFMFISFQIITTENY